MTEYYDWEIYNHGKTPIPEGKVQVHLNDETREEAEEFKIFPAEGDEVWPTVVAFRRVKEPVRGEKVVRFFCATGTGTYCNEYVARIDMIERKPIPGTYTHPDGHKIKIDEVG